MVLALLALAAAAAPRPFNDERLLLDRRLETLRRILPDGPTPSADAATVKDLAEGARLTSVEALARPPSESTAARADVVVDLTAMGRFAEVDRFARQVALSPRLIDVESLSVTATVDSVVKLSAVLRLPYRPARAALPAPPDGTRARLQGVPRAQADAYIRDMALALAKSETVAALRRTRRNPRLFLTELAAISRDRPVVLTQAAVGDDFVVRGLTVGEGSVRSLESRFERGFLRVSDFVIARQAACLRFEVRGKSPVAGPDAELPLPTEDPFDQDDAPCKVNRDTVRTAIVKSPPSKVPGQGSLSIRLRDVDTSDVFFVLHRLTGQGFLVDGDVTGRLSVELNHVTLEDALTSLAKGAGLRITEPGLIRRVSVARGANNPGESKRGGGSAKGRSPSPAPSPDRVPAGPPATFRVKRAEVREILAVMTDADPSLAALGPQGFLGRLSLWARDTPLVVLRTAVLGAVGLTERVENDSRILERPAGRDEAVVPVSGAPPDPQLLLRPQDLAVIEFEVAGLAGDAEGWTAFSYAPTGTLNAYRAGDRLTDGVIRDVQSTDVALDTDEGLLRLTLSPLP